MLGSVFRHRVPAWVAACAAIGVTACAIDDRDPNLRPPIDPDVTGRGDIQPFGPSSPGNGGATAGSGNGGAAAGSGGAGSTGGTAEPPPAAGGGGEPSGDSGAGGSSGGEEPASEASLILTGGAVPPGSNPFGIHGSLFAIAIGAEMRPLVSFTADSACIEGVAPIPPGATDDYVNLAGAYLNLTLNEGPSGFGLPWDKGEGHVLGFSFIIEGATIPSDFRFAAISGADSTVDYCTMLGQLASGERVDVLFDELRTECWIPGGARITEPTLQSLQWKVQPNRSSDAPFDFCVRDIVPIVAP